MPELPEVETVRRTLGAMIVGLRVKTVAVKWPKLVRGSPLSIVRIRGQVVQSIGRRGKLVLINLSNGLTLVVHLKMTGQLIARSPTGRRRGGGHSFPNQYQPQPNRHTRAEIIFADGTKLFYNDMRKFGFFRLEATAALGRLFSSMKMGPEPLGRGFTEKDLANALANRKKSAIKSALLDQKVLVGLGNIYADEALFAAGVNPARRVGTLRPTEITALYRSIRRVLRLAIQKRGTTLQQYRDGRGRAGGMQSHLRVYGRTNKPCRRCRTLIKRFRLGGRSAHYCPACQPLTRPVQPRTLRA